jgi:hypothetical protein
MSGLGILTTGPWPFAQLNLNNEAQSAPDKLPSFCPGPANIEILMIEPATMAGSPASSCSCCHVHGTLLFNPYDNALGIAGFPNDLPDRQQQMEGWGVAIPISIPGLIGHTPSSFGPFPILSRNVTTTPTGKGGRTNTNVTYPPTGQTFDPAGTDWFKSPQVQNADFAFVCHSQGCNMLLDALKTSCKKDTN